MKRVRITSDAETLGGEPRFDGTRIPVAAVLSGLAGGWSVDECCRQWPALTPEHVSAALRHAASRSEQRDLRKALKALTASVRAALGELDAMMRAPESVGRSKKIAAISNALEMANDRARFFALGEDWRKEARRARKAGAR